MSDTQPPAGSSGGRAVASEFRDVFVGRADACRRLRSVVSAAADGGSSCVIVGEAGIGKTALLHRAAQEAQVRTIWVRGVESETALPFACAADLLTPLRQHFDSLPPVQRQSLERALALTEGTTPTDLAICAGALGVLAAASDHEPLVVLVDDLQWVDAESQRLLLFVARRLAAERLSMVFAVREQPGHAAPIPDLPVIRLTGLSLAECRELVRRRGHDIPPPIVREVARATGGNPLAVLETLTHGRQPTALGLASGVQRAATMGITVGRSLEQAWRPVLERLPDATRRALFVLAVGRPLATSVLADLLAAVGLSIADLTPAEREGLISYGHDGVTLRHPLLRQVLIDSTPLAVQLPAYRAIAQLAGPEQAVWYLSLAAAGPDEELASALVTVADQATSRGGHGSASTALRRAADLTSDPTRRAERLFAAATEAQLAGDATNAAAWSQEAMTPGSDPAFLASATRLRGRALTWLGQPHRAAAELVALADALATGIPALAGELLCDAMYPSSMIGDVRRCAFLTRRGESLLPPGRRSFAADVTILCAAALQGERHRFYDQLAAVQRRLPAVDLLQAHQESATVAFSCLWMEEFDTALRLANQAVELIRTQGAPAALPFALTVRSEIWYRTGHWPAAYADADEALQWAEELHQVSTAGYALVLLARLDAVRGHRDKSEAAIDRYRREFGPYQLDALLGLESAVLGLAALAHGDPETAAEHLEDAWRQDTRLGATNPYPIAFAGDLLEALARCGSEQRAKELASWLDERAATTGLRHPAALAHRCRGILAGHAENAEEHFVAALAMHAQSPMPFERARTLLSLGENRRRARQPTAARTALREAQRTFESLGAIPWADRARHELAAAGGHTRSDPTRRPKLDLLTPQELQIARLVATGKNNVQTAASLYISRKTVEAHLTHVYRKLGIRSRAELIHVVLAEHGAD
ncbi:ATP-binding protein [Cryptosporangium aurantiacum]|uniref:Regulatory protein, luxR family n=1 Tax=Cryptosporangium aurantiacum TaxID=134849 RepID=A0A1M7RE97_9ACTN|nr:LuxR family transcriptional regulator [Cryptosporangium aurantiacum]SHN44643.1 regulatory protein, luxR family [Cryptosporangium aurantiacum]